jgi:cytochrome c554/c'-like protein
VLIIAMLKRTLSIRALIATVFVSSFILSFVIAAPENLPGPQSTAGGTSNQSATISGLQRNAVSPNAPQGAGTSPAYIGTNQCFTCHRPQTNAWSETKHSHAFTDVPKKYQTDSECLKCHVTAFGKPGGYVLGGEKDLLMVGCEACHGPGALHVDAAKRFVLANPGEEAKIEKEMREAIVKTPSDKVCAGCHIEQAHGAHPAYEGQVAGKAERQLIAQSNSAWANASRSTTIMGAAVHISKYSIKTCGGCHYDQYKQWGGGMHSDLARILPAKYANNQSCQSCHANIAAITTNKMAADGTHHMVGVACETCHGPAFEHIQFNKQFISAPPLGPRLEQEARDSINQGKSASTCIQCHVRQTHKEHPAYERK